MHPKPQPVITNHVDAESPMPKVARMKSPRKLRSRAYFSFANSSAPRRAVPMGERTITRWASGELAAALAGIELGSGVSAGDIGRGGFISGEVSIGERKGKKYPIYMLKVELPWSLGTDGACSGVAKLPDISLEMLDDLEVEFVATTGTAPPGLMPSLSQTGTEAVQAAVREWASSLRKTMAENLDVIPLDPPTQPRAPRAAAAISEEESMSAGGAADLEEAEEAEDEIETLPHPDDAAEGEGEGEEEEPFTEEEVAQLFDETKAALQSKVDADELGAQLDELNGELEGKELQEKGRILLEVLDYLNNPDEEEYPEYPEEYPGPDELAELWKEVEELCVAEDLPKLKEEVGSKAAEDQWKMLLEVRAYLLEGDEEERQAMEEWKPTVAELDAEWHELMARVPDEEADQLVEVQKAYAQAEPEEKKRMVWDVRMNFIEEGEEEEEEEEDEPPPRGQGKPPPPRPPTDAELGGRQEVRRRGPRRGPEYEYSREYGFDNEAGRPSGEWDEYYAKEMRGARGGGRKSRLAMCSACLLVATLALLLTATMVADEEEGVMHAAMRLIHLAGPAAEVPAAEAPLGEGFGEA